MRKLLLLLSLIPCLLFSAESFEQLLSSPEQIQTKEDRANLLFYQNLYEKSHAATPSGQGIPKILHFIWLGAQPFPKEHLAHVQAWITAHPDWKAKFWTDRDRPVPHPSMEKILVKNFPLAIASSCYDKAEDEVEKAELLSYEILYQEGGVCVDHSRGCLRSLDPLHRAYNLYCSLKPPGKTYLSSCVTIDNHLLGAKPGHPILKQCLEQLNSCWDQLEIDYPGKERTSVRSRRLHRTLALFEEALKEKAETGDIVFPRLALFPKQQKWREEESSFETIIRENLLKVTKQSDRMLLYTWCLTACNALLVILFLFSIRRKTHAHR